MRPAPASLLLTCLLGALHPAGAQLPRPVGSGVVTGIVRDSISQRPLASAMVQLVPADSTVDFATTATSDSTGRFRLDSVPDGRYLVGFFHPLLDTLGLEAPVREVVLLRARPVRVELGVPSPATVRNSYCGSRTTGVALADSGAVVFGTVRVARSSEGISNARVIAEWLELAVDAAGMRKRVGRRADSTSTTGFYALCDVPSGGFIALQAARGTDSTDLLDLQVPASGILRRDLAVGPAASLAGGPAVRLTGVVRRAVTGTPVAGAEVRLGQAPPVRTDELGAWTITSAAVGTRMLDVRALGYTRTRRVVDVVPNSGPVELDLFTLAAVLDTVRVAAPRLVAGANNGFDERRRSTTGRFITPDDVARRQVLMVSDLFRQLPGMRVWPSETGTQLLVRGLMDDWCAPLFFIDGRHVPDVDAEDLDALVRPDEVAGIEVYVGAGVPARFTMGMGSQPCGSIVVWTKPRRR